MSYVNGSNMLLYVGGKAIGHCTTHTCTMNSETKERAVKPAASVTSLVTGLYKEKGITGLSISLSAEGLAFNGETEGGYAALLAAWKAGVVGGRRVYAPGEIYPFIYGFGLYDAKSNRFIDFYDYPDPFADYDYPPDTFGKDNNAHDMFDRYEDLYEVWQSLDISISTPEYYGNPHLIGDANGDLELNIIDATHIQRYTADLISKYIIANDEADTDRDGSITILDATRIQRTLANLCDIDGNPCI